MKKSESVKAVIEAQRAFIGKQFETTIQLCIQQLSGLLHSNTSTTCESLDQLYQFAQQHRQQQQACDDELLMIESHCLSLIIQSLFETNRIEEGSHVLTNYYGNESEKKAPFDLQCQLLQLLIHDDQFDEATQLLTHLRNGKLSSHVDPGVAREQLRFMNSYLKDRQFKHERIVKELIEKSEGENKQSDVSPDDFITQYNLQKLYQPYPWENSEHQMNGFEEEIMYHQEDESHQQQPDHPRPNITSSIPQQTTVHKNNNNSNGQLVQTKSLSTDQQQVRSNIPTTITTPQNSQQFIIGVLVGIIAMLLALLVWRK